MAGLRIEVDFNADVAYLWVSDKPVVRTEQIAPGVLVDLDEFGMVVGVEVIELGVDLPVDRLTRDFHVPQGSVEALLRVRPSVTSFTARQASAAATSAPASAWRSVKC